MTDATDDEIYGRVHNWIRTPRYKDHLRLNAEQYMNLRNRIIAGSNNEAGWKTLRAKIVARLGQPSNDLKSIIPEDFAIAAVITCLAHGTEMSFAESAFGYFGEDELISELYHQMVLTAIWKHSVPRSESFQFQELFESCEARCYLDSNVQGVIAFCGVMVIRVENDSGTHDRDFVNLRQSEMTGRFIEDVVKVIVFGDFDDRIISYDVFPGSLRNSECFKQSSFVQQFLPTKTSHIGSFKCRVCSEHYIRATVLCQPDIVEENEYESVLTTLNFPRGDTDPRLFVRADENDASVILTNLLYKQRGLFVQLRTRFLALYTTMLRYSQAEAAIGACVNLHNGMIQHSFNDDPKACNETVCPCKLATSTHPGSVTEYRDSAARSPAESLMASFNSCTPYQGDGFQSISRNVGGKETDVILFPLPEFSTGRPTDTINAIMIDEDSSDPDDDEKMAKLREIENMLDN